MSVSNKQNMLVQSLVHFFTHKHGHMQNMTMFLDLVQKGAHISLRVIDWFVTNYSREHDVIITNPSDTNPNSSSAFLNVHESYKQQLKAYSKRQFDPFCRRKRINFHYEDTRKNETNKVHKIKTTVGQLNFFKWAIENNIISFIRQNIKDIEDSMRTYVRTQREEKRKQKTTVPQKSSPEDGVKSKTRRRQSESPDKHGNLIHEKGGHNTKTLRKGTIVTNHTNTTVFFS
jgi:hypothetical protein